MRRTLSAVLLIAALVICAVAAPALVVYGFLLARMGAHLPGLVSEAWNSAVAGVWSSFQAHEHALSHALGVADVSAAAGAVGQLVALAAPALALAALLLVLCARFSSPARRRRRASA